MAWGPDAGWRGLPARSLIGVVRAYRLLLSPWLGSSCRFEPTCSAYAITALQCHGAMIGSRLTVCRLLRCHPWCAGGSDPVPETAPGLFTGLMHRTSLPPASDRPGADLHKSTQ